MIDDADDNALPAEKQKDAGEDRNRKDPGIDGNADDGAREDGEGSGYVVGYGKPPKATRFKRGQSGNPNGRRPGTKNTATFVREELDRKQWVMVDGRRRLLTNRQIMIIQQINKARKGDPKAFRALMEQDVQLVDETKTESERKDLTAEEHHVLESHLTYLKNK